MISDSEKQMTDENFPQDVIPKSLEAEENVPSVEELNSETSVKEEGKKGVSAQFAEWLKLFESETAADKKIRLTIDFMRSSVSQGETPRFKDFWEARRLCLPLFKENVPVKVRTQLWAEYVELSNEARRLKEILDEQSAFAIEQIELAIQAIERDLENFDVLVTNVPDVTVPPESVSMKEKSGLYNGIQKELQVLNTLATHVNALRKEIIKTEMRIRIKNKLLERLSSCGDRIFPKRKELIKNISKEFIADVEQFVRTYFQSAELKELPLHTLREEIKFLQLMAKSLTLNTQAFTATRLKLSECWDKVKTQERERKKEVSQKKQTFKQNYDLVLEKVNAFAEACRAGLSVADCVQQSNEISDFMRTVELGRDEVRTLKDELGKAKKIVLERDKELELERARKEKEVDDKRRERIVNFKEALNTLVQQVENLDLDQLNVQREELAKECDQISINKIEKQMIDRLFKQLKDAAAEKKEKALLSLSEDDLKSLEQLRAHLKERKERRQEIKSQLEQYRKALGGSDFDFEKAMMYRELIETEKSSLDKINVSIEELEEKIEEIES